MEFRVVVILIKLNRPTTAFTGTEKGMPPMTQVVGSQGDMAMSKISELKFIDKSFCFTGKMAELKRTQAEREARARGAQTSNTVNEHLDYLVIGSIPATGWKHGNYGRKIEKARELALKNKNRPKLIPESVFMDSIAKISEINTGDIDAKVVVCKYKFLSKEDAFDHDALEDWLQLIQESEHCHISVSVEDAYIYTNLFQDNEPTAIDDDLVVIQCRIVKQLPIEKDGQEFADTIAMGFEGIRGVDGSLHWFERSEGTAGYIRLLKEIPQNLRSRRM